MTPRFTVLRDVTSIVSSELDLERPVSAPIELVEHERLALRLTNREPETEYQIRIGNSPVSAPSTFESGRDPALGIDIGDSIIWPAAPYLESARGPTVIELRARSLLVDEPWLTRLRVQLTVRPGKLGEQRYQAMFEELRALSAGLVFDLVSRSSRSYRFVRSAAQVGTGTRQFELRAIDQTWRAIKPHLRRIAESPVSRLTRRTEMRPYWGDERLHPHAGRDLAIRGIDPRDRSMARPFPAPVERLTESVDVPEHAAIATFLDALSERARACGTSAKAQLESLDAGDGFTRSTPLRAWASFDQSRIEKLGEIVQDAREIVGEIRAVRDGTPFRDTSPGPLVTRSPVFDRVPAYSRVRAEMLRFVNRAGVVLDEGEGELLKPTWRMYEQWVLLQLLAALREAGLRCDSPEQLVRRIGRARFTLDFERGTAFVHYAADGRMLRVRYEPWIPDRRNARATGDSVYRPGGSLDWSPDLLIEVNSPDPDPARHAPIDYAVVIDAKYSERLREEQWEGARKYFEIHDAVNRRPIVRQVWLAHPGTRERIAPRDTSIHWLENGPDIASEETLLGALELLPHPDAAIAARAGATTRPLPVMMTFVKGLLASLGLEAPARVGDPASADALRGRSPLAGPA